MAESAQVLQTTTSDLNRVAQFIAGNTVSNMRLEQTRINKRILINQDRLLRLRSNENLIKARIYNNVDQAEIQSNLAAGANTQVDPSQAMRVPSIAPTPDRGIATAKFKAYTSMYGIAQLDAEINRVNNDVMTVQAQIRSDQKALIQIQAAIDTAIQNKPKSFLDSALGRVVLPSAEDLQKDKLAKSRIYNLVFLQQLSTLYLNYTTSATLTKIEGTSETQTALQLQRGFPDEVKLPETLISIRSKFWAHGQQFQDNTGSDTDINFVRGSDALNFDDPGSDQNIVVLDKWVSILRNVGKNTKITTDVAQFIKDNVVITNNTTVSEGIERKPDPTLSTSNSMNIRTQSYPATAVALGPLYIGSFEIPSITESVRKWWKTKQTQYTPLPACPNVVITPATNTDLKTRNAEAANQALINAGQSAFEDALVSAHILQLQTHVKNTLPSDAPDWVIQFNTLFNTNYVGQIAYPLITENTTTYFPQYQATITRVTATQANINQAYVTSQNIANSQRSPQTNTYISVMTSGKTPYVINNSGSLVIYEFWTEVKTT
jgi:hypothetical protein